MFTFRTVRPSAILALSVIALCPDFAWAQQVDITLPDPIPMGTTRGERVDRLVIKNAIIVS